MKAELYGCALALACGALAGCPSSRTQLDDRPLGDSAVADATERDAGTDAVVDAITDDASCIAVLGTKPESHACQHAEFGPFTEVVGTPPGVDAPYVNGTQRAFVVDTRVGNAVSYRPTRDGLHAILFGPSSGLVVTDGADRKVPLGPLSIRECARFEGAHLVDLVAGARYRLTFPRAAENESLVGFIEHPATFAEEAWTRECR